MKIHKVKFKDKNDGQTYWIMECHDGFSKKFISVHLGNDVTFMIDDLEIIETKEIEL